MKNSRQSQKRSKDGRSNKNSARVQPTLSTYRSPRVGFPFQMRMVHRYCSLVNLAYSIGTIPIVTFSANGLYDPDITYTGHQPMYFDQMSALYNHFSVISSRITMKGSALTNGGVITSVVGITNDDNANVTYVNSAFLVEDNTKHSAWAITGGINGAVVNLRSNWKHRDVFGGNLLANTQNQGTSSANPAEQSYYNIWLEATDRSTTCNFQAMVEIEYDTIWTEPIDVPAS